ncbi:MAG: hypothetical protein LBC03_07405 [Nitrososphaerota archaeon]|jgi:hypothetical protein|nr:hypothetical protein [Nitrososphaerota archaeon]
MRSNLEEFKVYQTGSSKTVTIPCWWLKINNNPKRLKAKVTGDKIELYV